MRWYRGRSHLLFWGRLRAVERGDKESKKRAWAGSIICALCVVFLLVDAVMKVAKLEAAVQGAVQVGIPRAASFGWDLRC